MGIATRAIPPTTGNLPTRAPSGLQRLDPMLAFRAVGGGAILIDTRPEWQRRADGDIPGAIIIEGNHLQWLRPGLPGLVPETAGHDVAWLVCCDEGYSSSSAAASLQALGPRQATDPIGASRPGAPTHCQWLHLDNQAGRGCHGLCDDCVDREDIMTDIAELHAQALDATGRIVAGIVADRWHADTPCDGWDVRALVNHVVAGNLWAAELAAGGTIEGVGDRLDGDVLGPDPVGSYDASAKAAAAIFHRPGALDAPCAVSYGPVPGSVYAGHRFLDVFIHGWDLAAATGQDTALDAGLRQACREVIEPQLEAFRGAGALAGPLPVPAGASDQTRFLALLGRAG